MKELCIAQGYVPKKCTMDGGLIFAIVNSSKDPCDQCNEDRLKCEGRPKKEADNVKQELS